MKKYFVLAGCMFISSVIFGYTYPSMTVRDVNGNGLSVNTDGSVNVAFTGGDGIAVTYGIEAATATINQVTCNDLTATYGISASTGNFTTLAGATAVTGVQTISANPIWTMTAVDVAVTSPTAAGQWCRTAAYVIYISTGAGTVSCWSKVGGQ